MRIVLCGKTASGKSTTQTVLCEKYGLKKIVTFTTRPPRKGEINGISYNFVSRETFLELVDEGFFLEYKVYKTCDEDGNLKEEWYYGTSKISMKDDNSCVVLSPSGLRALQDEKIEHYSFYLDVDEESLRRKQMERLDNVYEAERRIAADNLDFLGIEKSVDFMIDNYQFQLSPYGIAVDIFTRAWSRFNDESMCNNMLIRKPSFKKRVYVAHEYKGLEKNLDRVTYIISSLVKTYPDYVFLSPIHAFSYAYHLVEYQNGLDFCFALLDSADEMWVFDDFSSTSGVNAEIAYCEKYDIPYHVWDEYECIEILGV